MAPVASRPPCAEPLPEPLRPAGLEVHFEPVADLRSGQTVGAEALLRRRLPGGVVQIAARFLPQAEASGLLVEIGRNVIDRACGEGAAWQASRRGAWVAVNLSARQLADPSLPDWIEAVLMRHALPAGLLVVDVPEGVAAAAAAEGGPALGHLRAIGELGVRIAIDDVGTGAPSPSYLPAIPASMLKIDGRVARREPVATLAGAIVSLAHELGIEALGEGLETDEQLARMRELGCDLAQGYAVGRAVPASGIARALAG